VASLLGFRKRGAALWLDPCNPPEWKDFEITYRHGSTLCRMPVENPKGVARGDSEISFDGTLLSGQASAPMSDDGSEHRVHVVLG